MERAQTHHRKVAYLAGPVSGRIERAKVEFAAAQTMLESEDYEVLNPLVRANTPEAEAEEKEFGLAAAGRPAWQQVMRQCFKDVASCDEVWLVSNWQTSTGARLELWIAHVLGIPAYEVWSGREILAPADAKVVVLNLYL